MFYSHFQVYLDQPMAEKVHKKPLVTDAAESYHYRADALPIRSLKPVYLDWVVSLGCFAGQHDAVGSIKHGVGDV